MTLVANAWYDVNLDELLVTLVHLHLAYHSVSYYTMQDIAL